MEEKINVTDSILSFDVEKKPVSPSNQRLVLASASASIKESIKERALDPQQEDNSRKMTMFSLEALRRKRIAASIKPLTYWPLRFLVALVIWPFLRIRYNSQLNVGVVVAYSSLVVLLPISLRILPSIFCLYFSIFYLATVWVEFSIFMRQPRDEGFSKSIRDTISCMEIDLPLEMFGKRRKMKFLIAMVIPLILLVGSLGNSPFDISRVDTITTQDVRLLRFNFGSYYISGARSFMESDDLSGGFHSNPWLYSAGSFSLFIITLLIGYEIGVFYRTIDFQLREVNNYVHSFIHSYDTAQVEEMSIYFKNRRESWIERTRPFRIIDFAQTISLLVPILSELPFYFGDGVHFTEGYWNRFLPSALDVASFKFVLFLNLDVCIGMYIWKLTKCLGVSTHAQNIEKKLIDLNQELVFIQEFPQLFVRVIQKGKTVAPSPKDIVRWSDIVVNKRINDELLERDESLTKMLLQQLEKSEAAEELTFKEVCDLITHDAKTTITAFHRLKIEYEKLYSVVEYRLMGLIPLNRKTLSTVIVGLGSTLVTLVVKAISSEIIFNQQNGK